MFRTFRCSILANLRLVTKIGIIVVPLPQMEGFTDPHLFGESPITGDPKM